MVTELVPGIHWVGAVDWRIKQFHGHELSIPRGTTYNAYLILDEKVAVVDTVMAPYAGDFIRNIRALVDPARIDYVVINHAEPDHAGALPALMDLCPQATLVVSKRGAESVPGHSHRSWPARTVGTGDRIPLGRRELAFIEAPMLHWPDSMFTYVTGDAILMANDAFGQHYATAFRFNDQVDRGELHAEALKYYANILTPFSDRVIKKIDEVLALGLPVAMIAPSHGVIWRDDPLQIVKQYRAWAQQVPEPRAVVIYDSMWEATRRMAEAVGEGLAGEGADHTIVHMAAADRNDVITEIFRAKAVVVGSPTLNNGVLPTIAPILEDLKGLRFKHKIGAAFGSYGWSGESVKVIEEHFGKCGIPLAAPGVKAKWQPAEADLAACRALGRTVAAAVKR